jgi:hypothetical protein
MASVDWDDIGSDSAAPSPVKKELTPTQVSSFWWGCCGLAVLALLSSVGVGATLELCLRTFQKWIFGWGVQGNSSISSSHFWGISRAVVMTFKSVFVPAAVIASVVPILYWRGGLLQRSRGHSCAAMKESAMRGEGCDGGSKRVAVREGMV